MFVSTAIARARSPEEKNAIINAAKHGSMVSWYHVNYHGEYDFSWERLKNRILFDWEEIRGVDLGF